MANGARTHLTLYLTSGGPADRSFCLSLTAETAREVLTQTPIAIDAFPPNYLSNLKRHW